MITSRLEGTMRSPEHDDLMLDVVGQQMGGAGGVCRGVFHALLARGPSTLKEMFDFVVERQPEGASPRITEGDVRLAVTRLLAHQLVLAVATERVYTANVPMVYIRIAFPILAQFVKRRYGDEGELVALVMYEYHSLPADVLVANIIRACPALGQQDAQRIVMTLTGDQVLVPLETAGDSAEPPEKKARRETAGGLLLPSAPLILNFPMLAWRLRADIVLRYVSNRFLGDSFGKVVRAIIQADTHRGGFATDRRCVLLTDKSPPVQQSAIAAACADVPATVLSGALSALTAREGAEPSLVESRSGAGASLDPTFELNYVAALNAVRRGHCESIVVSRFGVFGLRVMKILFDRGPMEDRFIAEEALVTIADVRVALNGMLRDGFVRLLELPKTGPTVERQTKNSLFLWALSMERVQHVARVQTAKALTNARRRLAVEQATMDASLPSQYFSDPDNVLLSAEQQAVIARFSAVEDALSRTIVALQERFALMEVLQ